MLQEQRELNTEDGASQHATLCYSTPDFKVVRDTTIIMYTASHKVVKGFDYAKELWWTFC